MARHVLTPASRYAFSLVELSIVLVVLGLLVGGVLEGKSLIRAAQLRSLNTEREQWQIGVKGFKDKYFALPGDMNNATQFWGLLVAGFACQTTQSPDARTCNGNGDGEVINVAGVSDETLRFWQHLANAGLIKGVYAGAGGSLLSRPTSRVNASWGTAYSAFNAGSIANFTGSWNHYLTPQAPGRGYATPDELWNIDTKFDDGRPGLGNIMVTFNPLSACTTVATGVGTGPVAEYLMTSTTRCAHIYANQY